jgi:hypothetical protein
MCYAMLCYVLCAMLYAWYELCGMCYVLEVEPFSI